MGRDGIRGRSQFHVVSTLCDHAVAGFQAREDFYAQPVFGSCFYFLFTVHFLAFLQVNEVQPLFFSQC